MHGGFGGTNRPCWAPVYYHYVTPFSSNHIPAPPFLRMDGFPVEYSYLKAPRHIKHIVNIPGWFSVAHLWCLSDGIHNGWGLSSQRTTHIKIFLRTAGGLYLALGTNDSVDSVNQKKKASWGTWVWKCRIRGNSLMVPEGPGSKHPELEPPMVCRGLVLFGFLCVCWDFM